MFNRIMLVGALMAAATSAQAQETETYNYSVQGRLTNVFRATGSTSQTTTYVLDKANNRTSRVVNAPASGLMSAPSEQAQNSYHAVIQAVPVSETVKSEQQEVVPPPSSNSGDAQ